MKQESYIPTIYVNMLGEFSVTIGDLKISDQSNQAKKPWLLLEYLIAFRKRDISTSELIELIWADDNSSNPAGALKTLLFRSRKLLEPLGYDTQDLILQQRGAYTWNASIKTVLDVDVFEHLVNQIFSGNKSDDEKLTICLEALALYKGDYLPKSNCESWVVPISTYYHSLYLKSAHEAIQMLSAKEDFQKITDICQAAIRIEPFDEELHYQLIYALFKNGNQHGAMEHYTHTTKMFYNEFAITPSARLKDLYKIIHDFNHGIVTDISMIQQSLHEETMRSGAYHCEYTVFKDIYQIESRAIERTGDSIYLCLLTLTDSQGYLLKQSILPASMEILSGSIRSSLRRGDVYTRYSISQYMILLPTATFENGEKVLKRIIQNFRKAYTRRDLHIHYALQAILPD